MIPPSAAKAARNRKAGAMASTVAFGLTISLEPAISASPTGPAIRPTPPNPYAEPMPDARRRCGRTSAA